MRIVRDPAEAARLRAELLQRHRDVARLIDFPVFQAVGVGPGVLVGCTTSGGKVTSAQVHQGDFFDQAAVSVWTEYDPSTSQERRRLEMVLGDPQVFREERAGATITVVYRGLAERPELTAVVDLAACAEAYPAWQERMRREALDRYPPEPPPEL